MQLTDRIFRGLYRRGVMLEQMKEPALSRTVKQMAPAEPAENPREVDGMTAQEIIEAAELADIVDETDGRPLAEKLREAENSGGMLLVDAIDDEPYVSSQMGPMLALREQCAGGIRLAAKVLGTENSTVLVYKHISDSDFSIVQLCTDVGMSKTQLHRKMKSHYGITPNIYIKTYRLKQAAYMLVHNDVNISEVMYAVGFNSPSYFASSFRDCFGMSPREFVACYKGSDDEEILNKLLQ